MTKKQGWKKGITFCVILLLMLGLMPAPVRAAEASGHPVLTFGDSGITETAAGSGYTVSGTVLTIGSAGTYEVTGSCSEGSIVVKGSLTDVVLILKDLTLSASATAPVVVKKNSSVTVHVEGTVTLSDNEDPEDETSEDAAVAEAFEGAAIKVKSSSSVTFCGEGTLAVNGNAKNGIKGAAASTLTFADSDVNYRVKAVNNSIAADGQVIIYDGTFDIDSENDGIKAVPDETDEESLGAVTIYGGSFDIDVLGDGIQAESDLTIHGGTFDIKTFQGYYVSGTKYWNVSNKKNKDAAGTFNADTMSCKGLKLSGDRSKENELYITGGTFVMDTSDDAIHSEASLVVTGGNFTIDSGDDGMHANSALTLGSEKGRDRDPDIRLNHSYEGLEAANEYIMSGRFWVYALDDGVNAAGGSGGSSGGFNPGGPGHGGGAAGDFSLEVSGGKVYVNCLGDGLDSNGALKLTGGQMTVFSKAANGDDSPIDADGTITINGATVFTAGSAGVDGNLKASSFGQRYYQGSQQINANTVVAVYSSNTLMYSDKLPRNISYWMYTSPSMTANSASLTTGGSVSVCKSHSWNHSWGEMTVVTAASDKADGLGKYSCTACGAEEFVTLKDAPHYDCGGHEGTVVADEGYPVTFSCDGGVEGIDVYYTQDYTKADETDVTGTVSRDSDTGEPCSNGSGQVNFLVRVREGYRLLDVSATAGAYKNIKGPDDVGQANTYRITKITAALTVTVTTEQGHVHTLEQLDYLEPGCTEDGHIACWRCTVCGRYFADAEGKEELGEEEVILPAYCPSAQFSDVSTKLWYHEYIDYVVKKGLMTGISETTFSPNDHTTRAMIVTILYRLEGEPAAGGASFSDVKPGKWYTDACAWAEENGVVTGYGDGRFGPMDDITREQAAAILYRYAKYKGEDVSKSADLSGYQDASSVSKWALDAMKWANAEGLITGRSETELAPKGNATRAEAAAIIKRFIER